MSEIASSLCCVYVGFPIRGAGVGDRLLKPHGEEPVENCGTLVSGLERAFHLYEGMASSPVVWHCMLDDATCIDNNL